MNLPVFSTLDVDQYGLFPGTQAEPGLHLSFEPGLTFILGANGLGKTTLVTMMYRMLTGPFDVPSLTGTAPLGSGSLQARQISTALRTVFAQRVVDGARNASSTLTVKLGNHQLTIRRGLNDLRLKGFSVDGAEHSPDETEYQNQICSLVGVWSFGDWILVLRYLIFYFEDRRALVWDPSAQTELLRVLFRPSDLARQWTEAERAIVELDSRVRNLSAALFRETLEMNAADSKAKGAADVRARIKELDATQQKSAARRAVIDDLLPALESKRQESRLRLMRAQHEKESRFRELEHARLRAIEARFPNGSESAKYIIAQLLTSSECLFCGNTVPGFAKDLNARISARRCVVCGSDLGAGYDKPESGATADGEMSKQLRALNEIEPELAEAGRSLIDVQAEYTNLLEERTELESSIVSREAELSELLRRLPPEEADLRRQRSEVAMLRGHAETMRADLEGKRKAFNAFLQKESREMVSLTQGIPDLFISYASGFLLDDCALAWSPQSTRLGQGGETMEFPGFMVELGGANFPSPVRRSGPEQVSESQREFIDLAFRMALMDTATVGGVGSLVIDAPESSLDAVFSRRAAEVLARYGSPKKGNRLIVTSNLVEGTLIPSLLALATEEKDRARRIVDLFRVAAPTRATKQMEGEYAEKMRTILNAVLEFGGKAEAGQ